MLPLLGAALVGDGRLDALPSVPEAPCVALSQMQLLPRHVYSWAQGRTGSHCTVRLGHSSACVITRSYRNGVFFFLQNMLTHVMKSFRYLWKVLCTHHGMLCRPALPTCLRCCLQQQAGAAACCLSSCIACRCLRLPCHATSLCPKCTIKFMSIKRAQLQWAASSVAFRALQLQKPAPAAAFESCATSMK